MTLYGPTGVLELAYEPMLAEEVTILGRTVNKLGRLVMGGRFKGMGFAMSGASLIPFMGFLSSYELDAVSWGAVPMSAELGRALLALKSRSFATNFRKSDIATRLPDSSLAAFNSLKAKAEAKMIGNGGGRINEAEDDIANAIDELAAHRAAMEAAAPIA